MNYWKSEVLVFEVRNPFLLKKSLIGKKRFIFCFHNFVFDMLWFNKETEICFGKSFLVTVTNESQFDTTLLMKAMQYNLKNFAGLF